MKRSLAAAMIALVFLAGLASAQITVTSPAARTNVKAAPDYATEVLGDAWDMNERTDLGWRIFNTVEQYPSYLANISFAGGLFSAVTAYTPGGSETYSDVNITILDSAYPSSVLLGKYGSKYPIDADKYTVLAIRMYLDPPISAWPQAQLFWSQGTIYDDITVSNTFTVQGGWAVYLVDIPALGAGGLDNIPWAGLLRSLRFDPIVAKDKNIKIDWIRLIQKNALYEKTVTWTGNAGNVDLYLDNDTNAANGNLGLLASNEAGTSHTFLAGGLAPGDYYVAVAPTGTQTFSYSAGYFHINDAPIVAITKPSEEGSDQDFITVKTANPWDMAAAGDVDYTLSLSDPRFTTLDYEDMAGRSFAGNTVFQAESADAPAGSVGDPTVYFLHYQHRGATTKIDPAVYHRLTFKMGLAGPHSTNDGSVARVMWKRSDENYENVSQDIVVRHMDGVWIMNKFSCDLATLPLEDGAASPSHSGWTGLIDTFRVDPHEFAASRSFFFDDVRIAADWTADASFTIQWAAQDADGGATVSLYYDANASGYDGTLIASGLAAAGGSHAWNTSGIPEGTYYIYAVITDGTNENRAYSGGPVIIRHAGPVLSPTIGLSRTTVRLGATQNGVATAAENVLVTNTGQGTLSFQAVAAQNWISVSPAGGGHGTQIAIGAARTDMAPGLYQGQVSIQDPNATNSPQIINVILTVYAAGADAAPFGSFDTPEDQANVASSIAVTGWALDDIQVNVVKVKREPVATDPAGLIGLDGLVYIGDGVFVEGARPDVPAVYPNAVRNNKAGWGYMLLTNFLPNRGNGTVVLHAIAEDTTGHKTDLGRRTIYVDNINAVKPFGALDTPTQGGTASGSLYYNFGWALTPLPNSIPTDGHTIWVFLDGEPLGHPNYNQYRDDIAGLFPEYLNSGGAVGVYDLNTTGYANGTHNIAWSVTDNAGNIDGIGSRFFQIYNGAAPAPPPTGDYRLGGAASAYIGRGLPLGLSVRTGFDLAAPAVPIELNESAERTVRIGELGRIELLCEADPDAALTTGRYKAFQIVGGEVRALPIGSTFNEAEGRFSWTPGPGFLGDFQILILREDGAGIAASALVTIRIEPGTGR